MYTASTTVRHRVKLGDNTVVTSSRCIIDDIFIWSTSQSCVLLLFECICIVLRKYSVSLKIKKCHLFSDRFEYVGRDIMSLGNTTASSKYDLVRKWILPTTGDNLRSFVSFCNFYANFVPMFQVQCKPLRDLYIQCNRTKIPPHAWTPPLQVIFKGLKEAIVSSPLLGRYDSNKPIFLKTDWSATEMGYILLQSDDYKVSRAALHKLRTTGECDFDITSTGPRLRPIVFNSRTYTDTEHHYHGFVGEIACGRWSIAKEKRHLWGTHFYWLYDMKTTYKILYYQGPIHVLRRWCQELLAYSFSCIHRSHTMMVDVDYLSRIHDILIEKHTILANTWSLVDRAARPCAYKSTTLDTLLSRGKYSIKSFSEAEIHMHALDKTRGPSPKQQKVVSKIVPLHRCSSPITIRNKYGTRDCKSGWCLDHSDPILHCAEIQYYGWLSINRPSVLPFHAENILLPNDDSNVEITISLDAKEQEPSTILPAATVNTSYIAVDFFLTPHLPPAPIHHIAF